MQIAEIYSTVETHESLTECQEVTLVLENYLRDFHALAEWFRLKWDYENTPAPQRPTSLAWDVCKTNLTRTSRSGKSSPNIGSGRSSPSMSGKVSPKTLTARPRSNTSAPTSPLPTIDQPIIEGEPLRLETSKTTCRVNEIGQGEPIQIDNEVKKIPVEKSSEAKKEAIKVNKTIKTKPQVNDNSNKNGTVKLRGTSKTGLNKNNGHPKINKINSKEKLNVVKSAGDFLDREQTAIKTDCSNVENEQKVTVVKGNEAKDNAESFQDPAILEIRTKNNMPSVKNDTCKEVTAIDSPSEDQRTYDIIRKTGVQSAEKSTSTEDDFPKLLPVKKVAVSKVNQECQTDVSEKKPLLSNKIKIEPPKVTSTVRTVTTRPAYSTALARSQSARTVSNVKPKVECKVAEPKRVAIPKPQRLVGRVTTNTSAVSRTGLARSKTVGDMKSTNVSNFRSANRLPLTKPTAVKNIPLTKEKQTRTMSNDCASSVETLVNQGGTSLDNVNLTNSSNSITSSSETLNNDDIKNNSLHSDGWLTVKNRSRFRSGYQKGRKSDSILSWATRFHQVSATASLPALALLPEAAQNNKCVKDKLVEKEDSPKSSVNHTLFKRSHTVLSKMSVNKTDIKVKENETNKIVKDEKYKKTSDVESETDDNIQDDLATDEEDRRKALQLCEEEERLEKEIAQLQDMEIDVDTETDGTETDGELQGETDEQNVTDLVDNEDQMSLEARYEPMLAGKCFCVQLDYCKSIIFLS